MLIYVFMLPVLGSLLISCIGRIDGQAGRVRLTEDGFDSSFLNILRQSANHWDHLHFFLLGVENSLLRYRKLQSIVDGYRLAREDWVTASRPVEASGSPLTDRRRKQAAVRARDQYFRSRNRLMKEGKRAADRIYIREKNFLRRRDAYLEAVRRLAAGYLDAAGFIADNEVPLAFGENAMAYYMDQRQAVRDYTQAVRGALREREVAG